MEQYRKQNALPKTYLEGFHSVGKLKELFPKLPAIPKDKKEIQKELTEKS
jgi:hypothetical protein